MEESLIQTQTFDPASAPGPYLYQLAPHACSAVQLMAVWSDQAVGPSGFPDGDGMISPAVLAAVALAPEERGVGRDSLYGCASRPSGMPWSLLPYALCCMSGSGA